MLTDQWRTEAFKRFPDLAVRFQQADTSYLLWFELRDAFKQAYRSPRNEDLIKRVYDYCDWCIDQPAGTTAEDDLATCVSVCFFEHIPEVSEAVEDMPRWFSRADVLSMKDVFSYLVGSEGYAKVLARFDRHPTEEEK